MSNELTPGSSKRFALYYNDLEWMFFLSLRVNSIFRPFFFMENLPPVSKKVDNIDSRCITCDM